MRILPGLVAAALLVAGCTSDEPTTALDSDEDGFTDEEEIAAGSDPNNATSLPILGPLQNITQPIWGAASAPIRPGTPIGWCTWNFLFWAPNGSYYIGTAAHCSDGIGARMPLAGYGEIGTVVYDSDNSTPGSHADFALVLLDAGKNLEAYPEVVNREGPTGYTMAGDVAVGDVIEHHGYGMVFGDYDQTRDREGVFSGWGPTGPGGDYCSESPIWWGDSGSPILHQESHKAFGIVSRAGWTACVPVAQLMGATLEYIFAELEMHGWGDVELATV